jgi:NADH:ubiquinone oxidoreductase subunit E
VRSSDLLVNQATSQLGIESGEVTSDGLFSIEQVNCLGACALGPIVVENGSYHDHMTPARLRKLIESIYEKEASLKETEVEVYAEVE